MIAPAAFTPSEGALLRRAWICCWPVSKIVAELAPREPAEILRQIDLMLARPSPSRDGEWGELERTCWALPGRLEIVPSKPLGYRLDGRPATLAQVIAAANRFLARMGYDPIAYPLVGTIEIPSVRSQTIANGVRNGLRGWSP